jgi:glycosyltransferase involved in cell wall biosynthesis
MQPVVSIVVPHRNSKHTLPRLLESIQAQSLRATEAIIVDDRSDESCADVVDAWRNKGLNITLVEAPERLYTKNARLLGIEKARADIIAFADADDMLWGTENLEANVDLYREYDADIVQFRCVYTDNKGNFTGHHAITPLAAQLRGEGIFEQFIGGHMFGIWSKLYSRKIWLSLLSNARKAPVRHQYEDLCLTLFYFTQARNYVGSGHIGYGYCWSAERDRHFVPQMEKAAAVSLLREHFIAWMRERGYEEQLIALVSARLRFALAIYCGRACRAWSQGDKISPLRLEGISETDLLRTLFAGIEDNAEKLERIHTAIFPERTR